MLLLHVDKSTWSYCKTIPSSSGPIIYIANAITPFSPEDIVVYSNCNSIRITVNEQTNLTQAPELEKKGILHPPIIFKNTYSFVDIHALHRANKPEQCSIIAEGFIGSKIVAATKSILPNRNEKIVLTIDSGFPLQANGSDIVTTIASIVDKDGHIKHL